MTNVKDSYVQYHTLGLFQDLESKNKNESLFVKYMVKFDDQSYKSYKFR